LSYQYKYFNSLPTENKISATGCEDNRQILGSETYSATPRRPHHGLIIRVAIITAAVPLAVQMLRQ
jgi:hypothetical protein